MILDYDTDGEQTKYDTIISNFTSFDLVTIVHWSIETKTLKNLIK